MSASGPARNAPSLFPYANAKELPGQISNRATGSLLGKDRVTFSSTVGTDEDNNLEEIMSGAQPVVLGGSGGGGANGGDIPEDRDQYLPIATPRNGGSRPPNSVALPTDRRSRKNRANNPLNRMIPYKDETSRGRAFPYPLKY